MTTITSARIVPSNLAAGPYQAEVHATFEGGQEVKVLSYYDDELHFSAAEFVGLTQVQVDELFHQRDVAYLRS